jgi:cytochrome c oxidase subunit 3
MVMTSKPLLDVAELPDHAFGSRDPVWWGVVLLMAIEGTMMALLLASYFYLRGNFETWPPTDIGSSARILGGACTLAMLVSSVPTLLMNKAARREARAPIAPLMWLVSLIGSGALVLRIFELRAIPFRWTTHAYGSLIWTALGFHTLHLVTGQLENLLFAILPLTRRFETKHFVDADLNGIFWLFVVAESVVLFAIFYGESLLLGT